MWGRSVKVSSAVSQGLQTAVFQHSYSQTHNSSRWPYYITLSVGGGSANGVNTRSLLDSLVAGLLTGRVTSRGSGRMWPGPTRGIWKPPDPIRPDPDPWYLETSCDPIRPNP